MVSESTITVAPIDLSNWRETLGIRVTADQLRFVGDHQPVALVILAKAYLRPGNCDWLPLALISEGTVVGIAALAHAPERAECEIFHFAIDAPRQGQGLGRTALRAMVDHIGTALPACGRIFIRVNPDNRIARHLYESEGFRATGAMRDGEPILARNLREPA